MPYVAVVQRRQAGVYETLRGEFENRADLLAAVRVIWDRRQDDRRKEAAALMGIECRTGECRHRPWETWMTLGLVLVAEGTGRR